MYSINIAYFDVDNTSSLERYNVAIELYYVQSASSFENKSSNLVKNHLAKLIKGAREDANQDSLGIATLLGIIKSLRKTIKSELT